MDDIQSDTKLLIDKEKKIFKDKIKAHLLLFSIYTIISLLLWGFFLLDMEGNKGLKDLILVLILTSSSIVPFTLTCILSITVTYKGNKNSLIKKGKLKPMEIKDKIIFLLILSTLTMLNFNYSFTLLFELLNISYTKGILAFTLTYGSLILVILRYKKGKMKF